ncbi:Basic amino-acid permease [Thecaphora frezii]
MAYHGQVTAAAGAEEKSLTPSLEKNLVTSIASADAPHDANQVRLARKLSSRVVQMIALAGTIGTGLFLGSGKSLAAGGPASLLICYAIAGAVVYLTMLALGEMATLMPISGSFGIYAGRFVDESFGFAVISNYWLNDAVSTAADLVAAQILLQYWVSDDVFPGWAISLIFLAFLIGVNVISVRGYAELEYLLSLLKVCTIVIFIIVGIVVNAGVNDTHSYLGFRYWTIGDAPFVGGFGGFASVFVTASFALGGTESICITAAETKNPTKVIPKTIRNVFWRIIIFYILSLLLIGIDLPYNLPALKGDKRNASISPFTLVFEQLGSKVAGNFINAVVMTSVLSAGNHALYAGTRLLHSMAINGQAPRVFGRVSETTRVPWVALLATASISGLCFGSSFIGSGKVWTWLQNLVGVSNQLSWLSIGVASIRFRRALQVQGKLDTLPYRNWTQPWGPYVVIVTSTFMVLVQGWTAFSPWSTSDFFSYYVEIPLVVICYAGWKVFKRTKVVPLEEVDLYTDTMAYERRVRRQERGREGAEVGGDEDEKMEEEEEEEGEKSGWRRNRVVRAVGRVAQWTFF